MSVFAIRFLMGLAGQVCLLDPDRIGYHEWRITGHNLCSSDGHVGKMDPHGGTEFGYRHILYRYGFRESFMRWPLLWKSSSRYRNRGSHQCTVQRLLVPAKERLGWLAQHLLFQQYAILLLRRLAMHEDL